MTITAALIVFCKKKNTVFSLQKSEQEDDGEYELDDMPTDVEYTETDYNTDDSDTTNGSGGKHRRSPGANLKRSPGNLKRMAERRSHRRQQQMQDQQHLHRHQREATAATGLLEGEMGTACCGKRHLVGDSCDVVGAGGGGGVGNESEADDSSPLPMRHVCRCGADPRGAYQRMVVTAILEKPHGQGAAGGIGAGCPAGGGSESGDSDSELRTKYIEKLRKHYYALAQTASSDIESENEGCPMSKPPIINVTYVDDPPAYDCLDYKLPKRDICPQVKVDMEDFKPPQPPAFSVVDVHRPDDSPVNYSYAPGDKKPEMPIMFVELPAPREKKEPPDGASVVFVELPPKPPPLPQQQQKSDCCNSINGAVRMSSTSVVMHNGDADVCLNAASSPPHENFINDGACPRMQLCSGSEGFPSVPLYTGSGTCGTGSSSSAGFAVPTLAIIPPTPMSDSRPEDDVILTYIDDDDESDYNEDEQTRKRLIKESGSS